MCRSVVVSVGDDSSVRVAWEYSDDELAQRILSAVREEVPDSAGSA